MKWKKNIWFKCPSCEKRLVVATEAAGFRADCPDCGKNIPIPHKSTIMSPPIRTFLVAALQGVVLVSCVAGGWWWAAARYAQPVEAAVVHVEKDHKPEAVPVAVEVTHDEAAPADEINNELLSENVALQGKYNKLLQWMMENYRGKYPLPENLVSRLRIRPVGENNELNPELIEMLKMSDREQGLVQDIFDYVQESLSIAEMERAVISSQSEDGITITVPTFTEVGGELKEDLFMTLESTLGGPRFDRMVDVSGEDMREQFRYFGEASRTLTFQVIYPQFEGEHDPYVLIRDGWVIPEGDSVRLTKVTETAINELPSVYREYESMLPPGVSQYAAP